MNSVRIALAAAVALTLTGAAVDVAGRAAAAKPVPQEPGVWTVMTPATGVAARTDRRPVAGAVFDPAADTTFITWGGRFEDNYAQAYDHHTGAWSAPVKVGDGDNDSHNYPTIVQAHDGHLLVFRGLHNRELLVARSPQPHSLAGVWTTQVIAAGDGATYPMPFVTADGTIFVFIRETTRDLDHVTPTDTRPMKYVRSTDNGLTWQNTFDLTGGKYAIAPTGRPDNMNEIYIGQLRLEPATAGRPERVHIVYTLAGGGPEGHLHDRYHRNIYYTSFTPGDLHFHSAAGDDLGTSIDDPEQESLLQVAQTDLQTVNPRTPDYISLVGDTRTGRPFVVWMEIDTDGLLHDHTASWTGDGWLAQEFATNVRVREMEPAGPQTWRVYATPDTGIATYLLRAGTPNAHDFWRPETTIDIPRAVQRIELVGGYRDPVRILATGAASGRDVDTTFDGDIYVAGAPTCR
ncbi:BNR-4 repeat-containing protein [Hamadaea tsunoensis]|uniref:BNR-4 repeat-containing protein n=1 Tax=Hamadaea tsunoensis TaxID=53368 RepID=UPI000421A6E8|nr:BNR-4 repeat-containing protein [Hamadaea tsunoensis]